MYKKIVVVIVLLLISGEIVVRLFITTPSNQIYDPEIGWVYIPHTSMLHAKEGFARNKINNIGFNDDDLVYDPKNEYVLFLGDSFTEAMHVEQKYNFTTLIEDSNLVSINAGRSALDAAHYLIIYKRIRKILKPNKTIMVLTTGDLAGMINTPMNIIYNNQNNIQTISIRSAQNDNIKQLIEPIVHHSALATHLMRRLKPLVVDILRSFKTPEDIRHEGKKRDDKEKKLKKKILSYIFKEIKKDTDLYVIYIPVTRFGEDGTLMITKGIREEYGIINDAAKKYNIPHISATDFLNKQYKLTNHPPFGFDNSILGEGHLNKYGHIAVANAVRKLIKSNNATKISSPL